MEKAIVFIKTTQYFISCSTIRYQSFPELQFNIWILSHPGPCCEHPASVWIKGFLLQHHISLAHHQGALYLTHIYSRVQTGRNTESNKQTNKQTNDNNGSIIASI